MGVPRDGGAEREAHREKSDERRQKSSLAAEDLEAAWLPVLKAPPFLPHPLPPRPLPPPSGVFGRVSRGGVPPPSKHKQISFASLAPGVWALVGALGLPIRFVCHTGPTPPLPLPSPGGSWGRSCVACRLCRVSWGLSFRPCVACWLCRASCGGLALSLVACLFRRNRVRDSG